MPFLHISRIFLVITLLITAACSFSAEPNSIGLNANQMSIATGQPSPVLLSSSTVGQWD